MVCFYPLVSTISVKGNRIADVFPYSIVIYLKIMLAAFGFLYVDDLQGTPLNDDLRPQRVPFFPEYYAFWFFLGRFIGLSVTSTTTTELKPIFS
jgi:hypothetical protein